MFAIMPVMCCGGFGLFFWWIQGFLGFRSEPSQSFSPTQMPERPAEMPEQPAEMPEQTADSQWSIVLMFLPGFVFGCWMYIKGLRVTNQFGTTEFYWLGDDES